MTFFVDQKSGLYSFAEVVRHAHLALRHAAGGKVQHKGRLALDGHADTARVGAVAAIGAAPGRYHRTRLDVDKVQRHQALGHGHFGKVADAPQVMRFSQRHDAAAVLLRARHGHVHGLLADHLTVTALAVQRQQRACVQQGLDAGIRCEAAFEHGIDIARQHAHAVRVMPAEVGHDEVGRHFVSLFALAAGTAQNVGALRAQRIGCKEFFLYRCHHITAPTCQGTNSFCP